MTSSSALGVGQYINSNSSSRDNLGILWRCKYLSWFKTNNFALTIFSLFTSRSLFVLLITLPYVCISNKSNLYWEQVYGVVSSKLCLSTQRNFLFNVLFGNITRLILTSFTQCFIMLPGIYVSNLTMKIKVMKTRRSHFCMPLGNAYLTKRL